MLFVVVRRGKRPAAAADKSAAEFALLSIQSYFERKAQDSPAPESEDQIFGKMLSLELAKIPDDSIKQRIKRRLLDVVYEGVEEYRQKPEQQQQVTPVDVQYMIVNPDGSLQMLTSPES